MKHKMINRKNFFHNDKDSYLAESLRQLRTNMHFIENKNNSILIFTSSIPKEGKTTIAANYARSMAMSGQKHFW